MIINNLSVQYNSAQSTKNALSDINLSIKPGTFLTIIGQSGCGKSTLLHTIAKLCKITQGSINFAQKSQPKIGMIFQEPRLMPWLTVEQNIAFGLQKSAWTQNEIKHKIGQILELVNLTDCQNNYPNQLSGGMKQRVSIARTLVTEPDLLLLDEPFSALDAFTKTILQNELLSWWRQSNGSTAIFVTHDIEEAVLLGQRVVVMNKGEILNDITIDLPYPREIDQPEVVKTRRFLINQLSAQNL